MAAYSRVFFLPFCLIILSINLFSQVRPDPPVKPGIDVLMENGFDLIKGKKIALLTHHAGRTAEGKLTLEAIAECDSCEISFILTPEHGFHTTIPAGEAVPDDTLYGIPVISLYGSSKMPQKKMMGMIDAVVVDMQDIGVRSYTYLSTLYNTMNACALYGKQLILLDRPNPISGLIVDGGTVEKGMESFVGRIPVSYIHGCTFGELAMMINEEGWLDEKRRCDLLVVKMDGWQRQMFWEDTGLFWFPTSPHIPTPDALRGAAMLGVIGELGIISIGIGTTSPFQYFGSPDFRADYFLKQLNGAGMPGVRLIESVYRPFYGMYNGKNCRGFLLRFPLDNLATPYTNGIRMLLALRATQPELFKKIKTRSEKMFKKVTGSSRLLDALTGGSSHQAVIELSRAGLDEFLRIRGNYLLY